MATAAPANGSLSPAPTAGLSSDEMALYDRQIRLWGAQAQERIRSANILLISLRALGTEVAKSLTLAGVCSLTIVDDEPVKEDDVGVGQFFLRAEDVGKPVSFISQILGWSGLTNSLAFSAPKLLYRGYKISTLAYQSSQQAVSKLSSCKTPPSILHSTA
jgi:hypothetical protein